MTRQTATVAGVTAAVVTAGALMVAAADEPSSHAAGPEPAAVPPSVVVNPPVPVVVSMPANPLPAAPGPGTERSGQAPDVPGPARRNPAPRPDPTRPSSPAVRPDPSSPAPPARPRSLLKREDPVPDGVAEQVRFFLGGGGICLEDDDETAPNIQGVWDGMQVPFESDVCFHDFDTSRTLLVSLTGPGGLGKEMELEKERHYETFRLFLGAPGLVPGRWRMTARQPGASAGLEFTVQRATEARVWVERQFNGRTREAGEDIRFFVGGFTPGRTINLDLYEAEGRGYLTSFPVTIDGNGEAGGVLSTERDDRPGCYGISHPLLYAPGRDPVNFAVFCLKRPE